MDYGTDPLPQEKSPDRRRPGRLVSIGVTCSLGEIIDLSAKGMRVRRKGFCRFKPGTVAELLLRDEEETVPVKACIRWVKKIRAGVYEMGLEFLDVTHEQLPALWRLATTANKVLSGVQLRYVRKPR